MSKKVKRFKHFFKYNYLKHFSSLIKKQRKNPNTIPIIIINFNQLENLKNLVTFLLQRKFSNIVIVDNQSTYQPLNSYYETIKEKVKIEKMDYNYGHMVFFENPILLKKYAQGYYVVSDADILPNPNLPENFMSILIQKLDKYQYNILKVGFALELETIPDYYPLKKKVLNWEEKYWKINLEKDIYQADIDTTFALYKPNYPFNFFVKDNQFYNAIRIAGDFTSKHMGWYINPKQLSEEQSHYLNTATASASWKFDESRNLDSPSTY